MKWIKRIALVLVVTVAALATFAVATARRTEHPVGLQVVRVESPSGPIAVALWYPTDAAPRPTTFIGGALLSVARDAEPAGEGLPLVVVSHGNGGSATSHVDLAMDLASAGYVVATPTHAGDNLADASRQGDPAIFSQRAGQLRATLDHVLTDWSGRAHVDPARVGAYGMSAGGFTVLTLVGGTPRMAAIAGHCRDAREFVCDALAHAKSPLLQGGDAAGAFAADPRVRAAVVAAPGLGFTFAEGGLAAVRVPVQLWKGEHDDTVPAATNADVIAHELGDRVEAHDVAGATHLSFLAPCGLLRPPGVCSDRDGFDREAMHADMNRAIRAFFDTHL